MIELTSIFLLFISLMQWINGAHFSNITFLFLLLEDPAVPVFGTVMILQTSMYTSL